ncbi:MAG: substrate-binding domain-containing protein [Woeseiaceae bacterium]|nr:substrate-binding domain-containing protein [Woeseiaceae bacterium]
MGASGRLRAAAPRRAAGLILLAVLLAGCERETRTVGDGRDRLVLYTSLDHERVVAIADGYRDASGAEVVFLIDEPKALIERMSDHGVRPPADVLLTDGLGAVVAALDEDVLRPLPRNAATGVLDDPDGYWRAAGFARDLVVFHSETDVSPPPKDYAALADAAYSGRLCLRRGALDRSRALVASMIVALGERDAELAVRGWRSNLASSVFDSEDELVGAVAAGTCPIAIVGSDTLERHRRSNPVAPLGIAIPEASWRHPLTVGVARHASDADAAARFVDWLLSAEGQRVLHADRSYHAVGDTAIHDRDDPATSIHPAAAAYRYADAVMLIERARYR